MGIFDQEYRCNKIQFELINGFKLLLTSLGTSDETTMSQKYLGR